MAASIATHTQEVFISTASIQLAPPQLQEGQQSPIYEWHTQVTAPTSPTGDSTTEAITRRITQTNNSQSPSPKYYYTPPPISGKEAERKYLPQTLGNFFEAERYASAWNRTTQHPI
ncbi:uncharacterized protein LOC115625649 [Scaptodrosophila lebanonensis]|uniref:Uncharacterized protein LOC115625649 n=1 Tax=Drosophila lebanonensis TaxID=7225 RepID=A0A6J2TNT2_DROLE|nr:uncharacterized protein LOC115625649 [Scaptodrosophila lebanonensis]